MKQAERLTGEQLKRLGYEVVGYHLFEADYSYREIAQELYAWHDGVNTVTRFAFKRYGEHYILATVYQKAKS